MLLIPITNVEEATFLSLVRLCDDVVRGNETQNDTTSLVIGIRLIGSLECQEVNTNLFTKALAAKAS
jgi:hypothetical protein